MIVDKVIIQWNAHCCQLFSSSSFEQMNRVFFYIGYCRNSCLAADDNDELHILFYVALCHILEIGLIKNRALIQSAVLICV